MSWISALFAPHSGALKASVWTMVFLTSTAVGASGPTLSRAPWSAEAASRTGSARAPTRRECVYTARAGMYYCTWACCSLCLCFMKQNTSLMGQYSSKKNLVALCALFVQKGLSRIWKHILGEIYRSILVGQNCRLIFSKGAFSYLKTYFGPNNPAVVFYRPQHGGDPCQGDPKGHYKICNPQVQHGWELNCGGGGLRALGRGQWGREKIKYCGACTIYNITLEWIRVGKLALCLQWSSVKVFNFLSSHVQRDINRTVQKPVRSGTQLPFHIM